MLASSAITTSMGAYAVMVSDRENKCIKDFYSSPLKRSSVAAGYMCTGLIISIILGTLIGFLVGAYICIDDLPEGIQWVIKCLPCAHAAVLFRQLLMADGMAAGFANLSDTALTGFQSKVGVTFEYGDWNPEVWFQVLVLIGTGIVFYLLAIIYMPRKAEKY